jgi:SAM-dependent methyltransferase
MSHVQILSQMEFDEKFPSVYFEIADENHFWCRWRMTAFSSLLRELEVDTQASWTVLDVGCGNGVVRRQIEAETAWTTDGTDFPMEALERNIGVRGATYRYNVYDERPEFRHRYDAIILFDVLEHIEDPRRFLKSLGFHLKPGGWLFINVPALEALRSPYDDVQGHLRRYTPAMLRQELGGLEFVERAVTYWGMLQIPLLALRKFVLTLLTKKEDIYKTGFQPPARFVNSALLGLMKLETAMLRHPTIGTSVLGAFQKKL